MYYRCVLLIGASGYAVTDMVKNWEDITVSFKRNDYDGVVRSFTDKFEFIKGARALLLDELERNYLNAKANVIIYTRNNSWEWTERFRCALNFATLSDDGYVLSMNAIDDSVASLIKAKKGTQYEYPVDELKDSVKFNYDRITMIGKGEWIYTGESLVKDGVNVYSNNFTFDGDTTIPIYMADDPEIPIKNSVEMNDVELTEQEMNIASYSYLFPSFFKILKQIDIGSLDLLHVKYSSNLKLYAKWNGVGTCRIVLTNGPWIGTTGEIWSKTIVNGLNDLSFDIEKYIVGILDRNIYFVVQLRNGATCELWHSEEDSSDQRIKIEYYDRGKALEFDVISPQMLLNRLLQSMNGGVEELTGIIVPSGEKRLDNAMILAAESVRQMPDAKIYSSFTKFCDWMKSVFGYVYDINGKTITFRPRKDYFSSEVVKKIDNFNEYTMSVNSSLVYSQVNVGYDKQDYDSVNGKDEFRFTNHYTTGITMTENRLDLISPYRSDAYGIEFLAQKSGEDTTDNSSDTDVFFVCARSDGNKYILDRSDSISGVISPLTMFNVMYSPTSMIEANNDYLGGLISRLDYASSEGNTDVSINGKFENRDIPIEGGIFLAQEVEIETSDIEPPKDMAGIVELEYQGKTIHGYYKGSDFHYTKAKSSKITLIVKK